LLDGICLCVCACVCVRACVGVRDCWECVLCVTRLMCMFDYQHTQVQIKGHNRWQPARVWVQMARTAKLDGWKACDKTDGGWPATGLVTIS